MNRNLNCCALLLVLSQVAFGQTPNPPASPATNEPSWITRKLFDYLNMAAAGSTATFTPLSQRERNSLFAKSLVNPVWFVKGAISGGLDQWNDKPPEWEQGASGYGKRVANIMGQYAIQRTVTFGVSSLLHEDNRYFGSKRKGFWRRSGYALSTSIFARHDNGKLYPSVSLISGFAAGAFVSRSWQPESSRSAGDGAVSFGLSIGYNALAGIAKEFLPDIARALARRQKPASPTTPPRTK